MPQTQPLTLAGVDMQKVSAIVWRILSEDTVQDARAAAEKIKEAAEILTNAGLRILGVDQEYRAETRSRSLDQERIVTEIVAEYFRETVA